MNRIISIMQPTYIPWIGYFDLIDKVDLFVFYDDVQLAKRSWQVRNRLLSKNGEVWLTIPISKTKKRDETLIKESMINHSEKWLKKHKKTIEFNYKGSPFYAEVMAFVDELFVEKETLADFNIDFITETAKRIGIETPLKNSSEINGITGSKDFRLVNICKTQKADQYLSPQGSADYINAINEGGEFVNQNIELYYHAYNHPQYSQNSKEFVPYIGILDLLFNVGFKNSLSTIRNGRAENIYYTDL